MKFIIDAQLPASLKEIFSGYDIIHTNDLLFGNKTKDSDINALSVKENRIVITKDSDFYYSYIANRQPHKLILVKLGNIRIKDLKLYFKLNSVKILELISTNSFIILEKENIRVLD